MARMSISLPDDLKSRMDAHTHENWSAVAQEAFMARIERLEPVDTSTIDGIVERLKGTMQDDEKALREEGFAAGKNWAAYRATYRQVRRVAETHLNEGEWEFQNLAQGAIGDLLNAEEVLDRLFCIDLRERCLGAWELDMLAAGFGEGVAAVWEEVQDRL